MATVLRVAPLWDGTGSPPIPAAELRLEGGRVVAVGSRGSVSQPGDVVVERPDDTATPGFIDVHTHFCYPLDGEFQASATQPRRLAMLASGFRQAASWLAQGVTAARDVGTAFDLDIQLKELIATGRRPGPRLAASGRMLTMTGGKRNPWDHMKEEISGATEARAWTRRHLKNGPDVIKLYCTTLLEENVATYLQRALATPDGAPDPGRWASLRRTRSAPSPTRPTSSDAPWPPTPPPRSASPWRCAAGSTPSSTDPTSTTPASTSSSRPAPRWCPR